MNIFGETLENGILNIFVEDVNCSHLFYTIKINSINKKKQKIFFLSKPLEKLHAFIR